MLTQFLSNTVPTQFLSLALNAWNPEKNTMICMASFLSPDGRISCHFDNIRLKLFNTCLLYGDLSLHAVKIEKFEKYISVTSSITSFIAGREKNTAKRHCDFK